MLKTVKAAILAVLFKLILVLVDRRQDVIALCIKLMSGEKYVVITEFENREDMLQFNQMLDTLAEIKDETEYDDFDFNDDGFDDESAVTDEQIEEFKLDVNPNGKQKH